MNAQVNKEYKIKQGLKFKEAREKKKLSQVEVAKMAGMHFNYYARIERGDETANPTNNKLLKIAEVLNVEL